MRAYKSDFKLSHKKIDFPSSSLNLEIGCGVGWHPITYAKNNPNKFLIAIERTRTKFNKFSERLKRHEDLKNIFAVHADATLWIPQNLKSNSIEKIFLLYPNPEPKNPAQRWLRMPFFRVLIDKLKVNGEILLASNIGSYLDEAIFYATNEWQLKLTQDHKVSLIKDFQPRTHFEKKYLLRGEICREVIFKKN